MSEEPERICVDCLQPMPAKARKCVKCGRYYDWRRFVGQSATTLSLIIALVTVSTFAYNTWRSQNPATGIAAFTRFEQLEELLDIVNTGDVPLAVKSIRLWCIRSDEDHLPGVGVSQELSDADLQMANEIFENVALRTVGVLNPGASQALRIEYVEGTSYTDFVFMTSFSPAKFRGLLQSLDMQAEGLPAYTKRIACEYVVTYQFVSARVSSEDRVLTVPANCKGVGEIGRLHLKNYCQQPGAECGE